MKITTFGTLPLVYAATITLVSASKIFLLKKNWDELRYRAASRCIFFAIKVFNKPVF